MNNEEDVFCDLRENFIQYWNNTFANDNNLTQIRSKRPQHASQSVENELYQEQKIAEDALKIVDLLQPMLLDPIPDRPERITPIIDRLDELSEYLQVVKLDVLSANQFPDKISKMLKLLTHDMFRVELNSKSIITVPWYAHLLFQSKFINPVNSKSYRQLLRSFDEYWAKLIPNSRNSDKLYIYKLCAFVRHISSIEKERDENRIAAHAELKRALWLYEKTQSWKNADLKRSVIDDVQRRLVKYDRVERPEGNVGPEGGILSEGGCKLEIPERVLKKLTFIEIDPTVEHPDLPDNMVPITPTLICKVDDDTVKIPATAELPLFCDTHNDEVPVTVMVHTGDEWKEGISMPLKEKGQPRHIGDHATGYADTHIAIKQDSGNKNDPDTDEESVEPAEETSNGGVFKETTTKPNTKKSVLTRTADFVIRSTSKIVLTVKKGFAKDTVYTLYTDVWYSQDGNFEALCRVDNKTVHERLETKMKESGFKRAQGIINPVEVFGNDRLSVQMENAKSKVVVFKKPRSESFSAVENVATNSQGYGLSFSFKTFPVGEERLALRCSISCNEETKRSSEWNLTWPDLSGGIMRTTFFNEVKPSFRQERDPDFQLWANFAQNALELNLEDFPGDERNFWYKLFQIWENKHLRESVKERQAYIRSQTIEYREKELTKKNNSSRAAESKC